MLDIGPEYSGAVGYPGALDFLRGPYYPSGLGSPSAYEGRLAVWIILGGGDILVFWAGFTWGSVIPGSGVVHVG